MGIGNYDIQDPAFDRSLSEQYELSILLGMDSFTYIVRDKRSDQLLAYRDLEIKTDLLSDWVPQMQRAVQSDALLRPNLIKNVHLSFLSDRVTLLPERLFESGKETDYMAHLTDISLDDKCMSERISGLGVVLVYAIGEERMEATKRRFSPVRTRHFAAGLLSQWSKHNATIVGQRAMYGCIRDTHLILAGLQDNKVQYFNIFQWNSEQDAIYFIHLAFQQCGWSVKRTPIYLSGEVTTATAFHQEVYRFVEDIRFSEFNGSVISGTAFSEIPDHVYFDLLSQFS